MTFEPKNFSSLSTFSKASQCLMNKSITSLLHDADVVQAFESSIVGGFAATPIRLLFDSQILNDGNGLFMNLSLDSEQVNVKKYRVFSKIMKFGENNQYGKSMSQNIPFGGL